jgi:uncharacterized membrane protein (Fun14 family)
VNVFSQKALGTLTNLAADRPWRSKSVLAALAAVVAGLGLWCSDIKSGPPQSETNNVPASAPANTSGITPPSAAVAPAETHWNWSKPFPFYVRMGASYVVGFCVGWFFRKLTRLILVAGALVIALLAYGKLAGWDTTHAQEEVKRGGEWAQHEATAAETYLKNMLPSATAGGAGIFLGFRRRSKATAPVQPAAG